MIGSCGHYWYHCQSDFKITHQERGAINYLLDTPTGYRTSLCNTCFSGGGLEPVFNSIEGEALMKLSHTCDPKSLALVQNITDIRNRKSQIQHDLVNFLSKVVDIRTGQRHISEGCRFACTDIHNRRKKKGYDTCK